MQEVERFEAENEAGEKFVVVAYQHETTFRPLDGPRTPLAGATEYLLEDGSAVSPRGDDKFEIVDTGEIIHRIRNE